MANAVEDDYRKWLLKVAYDHCYRKDVHEVYDLAQEGSIAMWRARKTYKPDSKFSLETHLKMAARYRIIDVARGKAPFGKPPSTGSFKIPEERATDFSMSSDSDAVIHYNGKSFDIDIPTQDIYDGVALAYHRGEIMKAINELPPLMARRVVDRFWNGIYDGTRGMWWTRSKTGARDRLREKLSHLKEII